MKISAKAGQQVFEVVVLRQNGEYVVEIDGMRHVVDARKLEGNFYSLLTGGRSYEVSMEAEGDGYRVRHGAAGLLVSLSDPSRQAREGRPLPAGPLAVVTAMPGRVVRVLVAVGDAVEEGQGVVVVEAMKMENEIQAPKAGCVRSIAVEPGQIVESGGSLLVLE